MRQLVVHNETRGHPLADQADIADSSASRCKGLLGREGLGAGQGLWIVPCQSVHCWGMRFPIDVIYLDRRRRVRKLRRSMKPFGISVCWLAHSVLELPAGTIDRTQTGRGDQLRLAVAPVLEQPAGTPATNSLEVRKQSRNLPMTFFLVLQVLDLLTTLLAFAHGGKELDPFVRAIIPFTGRPVAVLVSRAALVGIVLAFARRRKRILVLADFLYVGVVVWNFVILSTLSG